MILSASRRTDIPAFYSEWLLNRLREGYALVQNPRNPTRYSRVSLSPESVDCMVFWTKNPAPMLSRLDELAGMGYPFYFQFTLTPYGSAVEPNLPPKNELLSTFRQLSGRVGANRVVWRYDPVILTDEMDIPFHLRRFEELAAALEGCTTRCIFSYLDFYPSLKKRLRDMGAKAFTENDLLRIAEGFSETARRRGLRLFTCCEPTELSRFGISRASCIDRAMVEDILGCPIRAGKDMNQRPGCGCIESVELGAYDSCPHGCAYCYASSSPGRTGRNAVSHDPAAPALFGTVPETAEILEREMISIKERQQRLY